MTQMVGLSYHTHLAETSAAPPKLAGRQGGCLPNAILLEMLEITLPLPRIRSGQILRRRRSLRSRYRRFRFWHRRALFHRLHQFPR